MFVKNKNNNYNYIFDHYYRPGSCHYNIKNFVHLFNKDERHCITIYFIHKKGKYFLTYPNKLWYFHVFCVVDGILYDFDYNFYTNDVEKHIKHMTYNDDTIKVKTMLYSEYIVLFNKLDNDSKTKHITKFLETL